MLTTSRANSSTTTCASMREYGEAIESLGMRQLARACVVSIVATMGATAARANGRPPGTSSINFRPGHDADIAVGMTFGLLVSHDHGTTWQWMCEQAIGYGGIYDPLYVY